MEGTATIRIIGRDQGRISIRGDKQTGFGITNVSVEKKRRDVLATSEVVKTCLKVTNYN